jgi:hypothetical protein
MSRCTSIRPHNIRTRRPAGKSPLALSLDKPKVAVDQREFDRFADGD